MIEFKNVSKSFGDKKVIENLSLAFPEKGIVAFIGPSGCGKSTLLRLILGLEKPDNGVIASRAENYSVVFEDDVLLPWLNTRENVSLVVGGDQVKAQEALETMQLGKESETRIADLSGGMKRRVAIARALAHNGECLILDEPTIRLNDKLADAVMNQIKANWQEKLVILVTHDLGIAERFADLKYTLPR